jgi:hypothetical protein
LFKAHPSPTQAGRRPNWFGGLIHSVTTTSTQPIVEAAAALRARGHGIVWLRPGRKKPSTKDWTKCSREPSDYRVGFELGLMTGRLSGDLVCVDLDGPDALELGREILPRTEMIDGRPGRPMSH